MPLYSILTAQRTFCDTAGKSKKKVLENIAQCIAEHCLDIGSEQLFENLIAREKLGSTGLGRGIAIPHCRMKNCDRIIGSLFKLKQAVDFDAIDGEPVDLLFVLLVPEQAHEEHLQVLASIAEKFNDADFCQELRSANNAATLFHRATSD